MKTLAKTVRLILLVSAIGARHVRTVYAQADTIRLLTAGTADIRQAIALAANAELQLSSAPIATITVVDIDVSRVDSTGTLAIWRGTVSSVAHWHWYTVAEARGRVLCLGGFAAPQLRGLSRALSHFDDSYNEPLAESRILARLADPDGGINVLFPSSPNDGARVDTVLTQWRRLRPGQWPSDTIIRQASGTSLVRVTMLSARTKTMTPVWVPTVYAFTFDNHGILQAWARREGEPFGTRQQRR